MQAGCVIKYVGFLIIEVASLFILHHVNLMFYIRIRSLGDSMFSVERMNEIKSRLKNQGKVVTPSQAELYMKQISAHILCLASTPFLSPSVFSGTGF
jgi:hypothetical protein